MAFPFEFFVGDDAAIAAGQTVITESAVPASGVKIHVKCFGGFDPVTDGVASVIGLQWGNPGNWQSIRAGGFGSFEFVIDKTFIGDGTKRFRVVRQNKSLLAKQIYAWASLA